MKILAIQGSPRRNKYTQLVLNRLLEGASVEGAACETIHLADKKIRPCKGCYTCWIRTPGKCVHDDDMPDLLERMKECDVEVYATPLYIYGMTGLMKNFMDRRIPAVLPYLEDSGGVTVHPPRYPRADRIVLVSVCGMPELELFDALVSHFRLIAHSQQRRLAGVLLRPGSESLLFLDWMGDKGKAVLEGFYQAGRELVLQGSVSPETEAVCSQDWTKNRRGFQDQGNRFWNLRIEHERKLREGKAGRSFEETAKNDIRLLLGGMAVRFRHDAFADLTAAIQFSFTGEQPGDWHFDIRGGYCAFREGKAERPALILRSPSEVWLAIARKELDGGRAFAEGKYTAEGDLALLVRMKEIFG